MARIFISYRRDDTSGYAIHLYTDLSKHFGREQIFMDIDTIEPGVDFVEVIETAVSQCDVLIALIGKQWLTIADTDGQRRLDNPEDFVRIEIATALDRNIRVIPVLVQGVSIPRSTDLPDVLMKLARRHAFELSDVRWKYDTGRLIEAIEKVLPPRLIPPQKVNTAGPRSSRVITPENAHQNSSITNIRGSYEKCVECSICSRQSYSCIRIRRSVHQTLANHAWGYIANDQRAQRLGTCGSLYA